MGLLKGFIPIFSIVDHAAYKTLLYQKFAVSRTLQRRAFQFSVHKREIRRLTTVHPILEIMFLDQLSKTSFSPIFPGIWHKITQTLINQVFAIVKY